MSRREAVGIGLVIVGLTLHFWNARRDVRPETIARAVPAPPDRVDPALHGRVVSVTGKLETAAELGDPRYLRPGPWIRLTRVVEMYAWSEVMDAGQPRYQLAWLENPQIWREFRFRNNHQNPAMPVWSDDWRQPLSRLGAYGVNPDAARLPAGTTLALAPALMTDRREPEPGTLSAPELTARMVRLSPPRERLDGDFLYIGSGRLDAPDFGDVRISWRTIGSGQVFTVVGEQRGDELVPHITDAGQTIWSFTPGEAGPHHPRPASERWGIAAVAALTVLAGLVICLGRAPLALLGGLLAQAGAVIAFFIWPIPAALLAAAGLAAAALTRLGPRSLG